MSLDQWGVCLSLGHWLAVQMALPEPVDTPEDSDDDAGQESADDDVGERSKGSETKGDEEKEAVNDGVVEEDEDDEDEEEETCGFCKYMKRGGCKESFVSWLECVEKEKEGDGDYVEKCVPHMKELRECMLGNPDYYGPMLAEEAHMTEEDDESLDPNNDGELPQSTGTQPEAADNEVQDEGSSQPSDGKKNPQKNV